MRAAIDRLDFGTVFRFWQDGTDEVLPNEDSPTVYGSEAWVDMEDELTIEGNGWFTVTDGMSNQFHYCGPVMHDSEFISTGMVEEILYRHDHREHYFTVQYVSYFDGTIEGWVILAKKVSE